MKRRGVKPYGVYAFKRKLIIFCVILACIPLCSCSDVQEGGGEQSSIQTEREMNIAEKLVLGFYKDGTAKSVGGYELKKLLDYDEIHDLTVANYVGSDLSIISEVKGLRSLSIMSMNKVEDIGFLSSLTSLQYLMIYDLSDDFTDIQVLSMLTNLEMLNINNISVSDFSPLCSLKKLKRLDLTSSVISREQYEMLRKALPNCEITNVTFIT